MIPVNQAEAASLGAYLASIFGPATRAILHYGSRAQGRASHSDSPFDFFIVVTGYDDAYRAAASVLGERIHHRRARVLARLLPPNAMSVRAHGRPDGAEAKCMIISVEDFRRECSARARDHFVQTRMTQQVLLGWVRDPQTEATVLECVGQARERSFDWLRVFLPPRFTLPDYCRTLIEVAFAHEVRSEPAAHAERLFTAQRSLLSDIYGPVLARLTERGVLTRDGEHYRHLPPGPLARSRVRWYFRQSKVRTSLRLLKHPFLYDDWIGYMTRKIERSTGQVIELTERERRWPLLFLWPRAIRYLRTRPQRRGGTGRR